jgi:zinc transporter ZupT
VLIAFSIAAFAAMLIGGYLPLGPREISRTLMYRLFALRAGILLGAAFTEILPEALDNGRAAAGWGALGAFVFLISMQSLAMIDTCPEYLEHCRKHTLSAAALLALTAHSFIDGFNLSLAYVAGTTAGAAIGLALALHKMADGFTLTTLLKERGYARSRATAALVCVALATPAGAAASYFGLADISSTATAAWLGFAGGSFIYIGAADILPRLHRLEDKADLAYFAAGLAGLSALRML